MSDLHKAAKMALDVLRQTVGHSSKSQNRIDDAKHELVQALANGVKQEIKLYDDGVKPKREWVNATHIEIGNLWAQHKEVYGFAMALDKLLQDKNR